MQREPFTTCAIAVMAKAPIPGRSKTRLCPPLSAEQAAVLSAGFHRDMFANIAAAARLAPIIGYAAYAPAGTGSAIASLMPPDFGVILADGSVETPADVTGFGRSLLHAIRGLFARGHPAACLLNSDSPTLPTAYLAKAAEVLLESGDHIVLGPAEDGGYYLIGMRAMHARLFADIPWSSATVATATRQRAASLGLAVKELPVWYDVDDASSLRRLRAEIEAGAGGGANIFPADATRAALRQCGASGPPAHRILNPIAE